PGDLHRGGMGPDRRRLQHPDQLNSRSSPSVASCLLALPSDQTDPRIEGALTLSPRCADWGSGTDACARRSDDTDAPYGVTSGPLAAGSAHMLSPLVHL